MPRQSISLTGPNDNWLKAQVDSDEYTSKSEVINDLIRKARSEQEENDLIRARLIRAEASGFTDMSAQAIKAEAIKEMRDNGELPTQQ